MIIDYNAWTKATSGSAKSDRDINILGHATEGTLVIIMDNGEQKKPLYNEGSGGWSLVPFASHKLDVSEPDFVGMGN